MTYTAPHSSGLVRLHVAIEGGKHIYNSPFTTLISPGEAHAPNCEVAGAVCAHLSPCPPAVAPSLLAPRHPASLPAVLARVLVPSTRPRPLCHGVAREKPNTKQGLVRGGCGIDVKFTIHARDRAGNHLIEGGLTWAIRAYPDNAGGAAVKLDVEIEDHKNGVYACVFRPVFAGPHTVLPDRLYIDT